MSTGLLLLPLMVVIWLHLSFGHWLLLWPTKLLQCFLLFLLFAIKHFSMFHPRQENLKCKSHLPPSTTFLPIINHFKISPLTAPYLPSFAPEKNCWKYLNKMRYVIVKTSNYEVWNWTNSMTVFLPSIHTLDINILTGSLFKAIFAQKKTFGIQELTFFCIINWKLWDIW